MNKRFYANPATAVVTLTSAARLMDGLPGGPSVKGSKSGEDPSSPFGAPHYRVLIGK